MTRPHLLDALRDQVLLYRRFGLMRQVTDIGLSAGMPLSATLIPGAVNAVLPDLGVLKYLAPASRCSGSGCSSSMGTAACSRGTSRSTPTPGSSSPTAWRRTCR